MNKPSNSRSMTSMGLLLLLAAASIFMMTGSALASAVFLPTDFEVKKTASAEGTVVSGVITIKNKGKNPAVITTLVDTLEVKFPKGVTPPTLLPGSEKKWFLVAQVTGLQVVPNPIPVGQTVTIPYNFDACEANTYTGANKMRNVVRVTLFNGPGGVPKTVTKHSPEFVPPSQAGCATCGDGVVNGSEECDKDDLNGATCVSEGFDTGTLSCTAACVLDTSNCKNASCGDNVAEGEEECDGPDLKGESCQSQGKTGGTLSCTGGCFLSTAGCFTCGNNSVEPGEACDGTDLNGATCESISSAFSGGQLACKSDCSGYITTGCTTCGDNTRQGSEECDGIDLNSQTCQTLSGFNFGGGTLACNNNCTFNTENCTLCGNGTIDSGEECDGTDFGGQTCPGAFGSLVCNSDCTIDSSQCHD